MAKTVPTKPLLIMLYGFPGAGKTYFARQFCESVQAAHVQGDRIRSELFENPRYDKEENQVVMQLMNYMAEEFLNAGISVVYDTNAARAIQRHALREVARKSGAKPLLVWFQVDTESSYLRSNKRDRRKSDDRYSVPLNRPMFNDQAGQMQNPVTTEDYIVISGKHTYQTQYAAVSHKLRELGLYGMDDGNAHMVKPGLVNLVPSQQAGRVDMKRRNIMIR
ncbi:MAG: ATP-binding protein [Candidatus Saccharimonadales bacterium]